MTALLEENGTVKGVIYKTKLNGEELLKKAYAPLTIVCDGCFSNLRRALCSSKVKFSFLLFFAFWFDLYYFGVSVLY